VPQVTATVAPPPTTVGGVAGAIDWDAAVRTGQRLAPRGPEVTADQAHSAVQELRVLSRSAELHVRETTGLGVRLPVADADVVDRSGWIAATARGMAVLTAPLQARLPEIRRGKAVAGAQIGVLLGYLSGKVLGQFDPLAGPAGEPGRLVLVAPNVIKVERELEVHPADFRLWVCLHESTHRLQFTAVPWMTDYFRELVADFAEATPTEPGELLTRAVAAVRGRAVPGDAAGPGSGPGRRPSWVEAVQTPEQRAVFDRLLALMTLLEGHADFVMDAVGPGVVPTVAAIRSRFSRRRQRTHGPIDRLIRALLGMDAKLAQYVKGAAFTRKVVATVGMDGFNAVWTSADTLPTRSEIEDPAAWVRRVHG
jgi:coenzyme F420 biosynthesis associated uncharacterized protein